MELDSGLRLLVQQANPEFQHHAGWKFFSLPLLVCRRGIAVPAVTPCGNVRELPVRRNRLRKRHLFRKPCQLRGQLRASRGSDWFGLDAESDSVGINCAPDLSRQTGYIMIENRELSMDDYLAMLRRRVK